MRITKILIASTFAMFAAGAAMAAEKSALSPEDIVKFFADQEATRGICVGTEEECGGAAKKPAGFNLRLTFDKDSADLTADAKTNLDAFAMALKSPSLSVASFMIEGHTDASGSDGHNMDLSQRRAESVVTYLAALGVDNSKLKPVGMGEAAPVTTDAYDPENRRVETRLILE